MTRLALTAALSLALLIPACGGRQPAGQGGAARATHATRGADVSSLTLDRLNSGRISLGSLRGRVVLLDLFATWCLPCIAAVPRLRALRQQYGPQGLEVVGLSMDLEGLMVVEPFCEELGVDYPVLLASKDFIDGNSPLGQITTLPMVFLIDRQGRVAEVLVGEVPQARLEQAVRKLLD